MFARSVLFFERLFWNFWWVALLVILCLIILEQAMKGLHQNHEILHQQWLQLVQEKEKAIQQNETLTLQINSQSDPAWVELTLMKKLGLVPEGQVKILFTDK